MARPLRVHAPGMVHHVMSRGNAQQEIFSDEEDYQQYLTLLASTASRFNVRSPAYCLMRTHVHLLLRPDQLPLWRMMQQLNSTYCQWFNRRHRRVGHVLQGRYRALLVDSGAYFLRALAYVLRNPVAAGYVTSAEHWAWSSCRATLGLTPAASFLDLPYVWRALDPDSPAIAQRRFLALVSASGNEDLPLEAWLFGSPAFAGTCTPLLAPHRQSGDFVYAHRFADRPGLAELLDIRAGGPALEHAVRQAFHQHGYTLREIGTYLRRPACTIWAWIHRDRARGSDLDFAG